MAVTQNAEASADRTPSIPEMIEAIELVPEFTELTSEGIVGVGPAFVDIGGGTYVNADRIETIATDADGRTSITLAGRGKAMLTDVSVEELLSSFGA